MRFGNFELYIVSDGFIRLDGGLMFGIVPKVLWEKTNPPDERNRILLSLHCLLIKTPKYNILIDTGAGDKNDEKFCDIYGIERKPALVESLRDHGLSTGNIDIVINTHLHFDHAGGNTTFKGGKIVPAFPSARYIVSKEEWGNASNPNERTKASYHQEDFKPLVDSNKIEFVSGEEIEVEPGIFLWRTGGHTEYHQCVRIESGGKVAIFLADLIPTVSHLSYPYIAGIDLYPLKTLEKKKELLQQAFKEQWLLIFQHDPIVGMGYLRDLGKKPVIEECK